MTRTSAKPDFVNGLGDSSRALADLAVEAIGENKKLFKEVVDLSFSQKYPINMRTARVAQLCCEKHPDFILPYLDEVIGHISTSTVDGVKRSYLKIIDDYIDPRIIEEPGPLVQLCFDWLSSPKLAVAIRYHSLGILLKISDVIPDLIPELKTVCQFIYEEGSMTPGLKNYIKKVLSMQLSGTN